MSSAWKQHLVRHVGNPRAVLIALIIGIAFAFVHEIVSGYLAAAAYPRWYVAFAHAHKHVSLELWSIALTLPTALIAACVGAALARTAETRAVALPLITLLVWVLCLLRPEPQSGAIETLHEVWQALVLWPTSTIAAIALPAAALILSYRRAFSARPVKSPIS